MLPAGRCTKLAGRGEGVVLAWFYLLSIWSWL
jgi:hypothetical protein